jgi:hypothetical protein
MCQAKVPDRAWHRANGESTCEVRRSRCGVPNKAGARGKDKVVRGSAFEVRSAEQSERSGASEFQKGKGCGPKNPRERRQKCTRRDSNPQPSVPKTDALSIELRVRGLAGFSRVASLRCSECSSTDLASQSPLDSLSQRRLESAVVRLALLGVFSTVASRFGEFLSRSAEEILILNDSASADMITVVTIEIRYSVKL